MARVFLTIGLGLAVLGGLLVALLRPDPEGSTPAPERPAEERARIEAPGIAGRPVSDLEDESGAGDPPESGDSAPLLEGPPTSADEEPWEAPLDLDLQDLELPDVLELAETARHEVETHPDDPDRRDRFCEVLSRLAELYVEAEDRVGALAAYRRLADHLAFLATAPGAADERIRSAAERLSSIGRRLWDLGDVRAAVRARGAAVAARQRLLSSGPATEAAVRSLAWTEAGLGYLEMRSGRLTDALDHLRDSARLRTSLAREAPEDDSVRQHLAWNECCISWVLVSQGRHAEALGHAQRGLEVALELAGEDPLGDGSHWALPVAYDSVGFVLGELGRFKEALEHLDRAREAVRRFGDLESNPRSARNFALVHNRIGLIRRSLGDWEEALRCHRVAEEIAARLLREHPDEAWRKIDLSYDYRQVGSVLLRLGQLREADMLCRAALAIDEEVVDENPENLDLLWSLGHSQGDLGDFELERGSPETALAWRLAALQVQLRLTRSDPSNAYWRHDLSETYRKLGDIQRSLKRAEQAAGHYAQSLSIREGLSALSPACAPWRLDLALVHESIARLAIEGGDTQSAAEHLDEALGIHRELRASVPALAGDIESLETLRRSLER